jgi:large subunit ribosomal protein L24
VDLKEAVVHVEGVTQEKADGEEVPRAQQASNLVVTDLNLSDDLREERLEALGGDEE